MMLSRGRSTVVSMIITLGLAFPMGAAVAGGDGSETTDVNIMVLYTQGMIDKYGADGGLDEHLSNLLSSANSTLTDSDVHVNFRLTHAQMVDYPDWEDGKTDRKQTLCHLTYGARELSGVHALRVEKRADLVVLMRQHDFPLDISCGIAWIGGENHDSVEAARDAPYGYAVVTDGSAMINGLVTECPAWTLTHELGHGFGAYHVADEGRQLVFPFALGYVDPGRFKTVMANYAQAEPVALRFSNPDQNNCPDQRRCGVEDQADNARTLNTTRQALASFSDALSRAGMPDDHYPDRFSSKCRQHLDGG